MSRPKLLDLFCGVGGAAMGYHRAGFEVTGVDVRPQPRYPFEFIQADAMEVDLEGYDVIHASPPCQRFTRAKHLAVAQRRNISLVDLLTPTRPRLQRSRVPVWILENVPGAPLRDPLKVCGSSFGLKVRRHRLFESNIYLEGLPCDHRSQGRPVGVYYRTGETIPHGGRTARSVEEGREAMGIEWADWKGLIEAIPPAYTEFLGRQVMDHLALRAEDERQRVRASR